MDRFFQALMALACFILISALWLGALGLFATVLMQVLYAFSPLSLSAWKALSLAFRQGGTVPLGFILYSLAAVLLAGAGETAILWRLPSIAASMPSPSLPHIRLSRATVTARRPRPSKPRAEPVMPPRPAPAPPSPEPPVSPPAQDRPLEQSKPSDSAILSRILALFDVWNEPPPAWMAEALRDEVVLLSPDAWPTLESLGSQGLDLLVTLREHDMLPESPAALRAIGEIEDLLRSNVGIGLNAGETAPPAPTLTLAAAWLCEALDNVLAAQGEPAAQPDRLPMAQTMFDRALRSMSDTDWASLDRFPEKAGRVRVLSDRLREDMRTAGTRGAPPPTAAAPPSTPAEAVIALLKQFGFVTDAGPQGAPLLAHRDDLQLLLQVIDLQGGDWRLPDGLLGPWLPGSAQTGSSPARLLWQQLARRRLRQTDLKPLIGLLVVHGGRLEQEDRLAGQVAADRRRSGIGLAWLADGAGPLPSLERELSALPDRITEERRRGQMADRSASPS